jgi:hypothetical protein
MSCVSHHARTTRTISPLIDPQATPSNKNPTRIRSSRVLLLSNAAAAAGSSYICDGRRRCCCHFHKEKKLTAYIERDRHALRFYFIQKRSSRLLYACRPTRHHLLLIEQFTNKTGIKKGKKFTMIIILDVLCGDDVSQSPSSVLFS